MACITRPMNGMPQRGNCSRQLVENDHDHYDQFSVLGGDGWCGPGLPGLRAEQSIALHSDVVSRPARTNESDFQLRGARRCEKTAGQGKAPNSCKLRLF